MLADFILIQKGGLRPRHGHQSFQRGQQLQGLQEHQELQEVQQHHSHHGLPTGESSTEFENVQFQGKVCFLVYRQKDPERQATAKILVQSFTLGPEAPSRPGAPSWPVDPCQKAVNRVKEQLQVHYRINKSLCKDIMWQLKITQSKYILLTEASYLTTRLSGGTAESRGSSRSRGSTLTNRSSRSLLSRLTLNN